MMFLTLIYLYPNRRIVPTWEIDQVWHQHILANTCKYEQDCQFLFGQMLHHVADAEEGDEEQRNMDFAQTKTLFKKHFGLILGNPKKFSVYQKENFRDDQNISETFHKIKYQNLGACEILRVKRKKCQLT